MLFNSTQFLIFFPVVIVVYSILPEKIRYLWLLFVSYIFYMNWNMNYGFLLFAVTVVSFLGGKYISFCRNKGKEKIKKIIFIAIVCIEVGILIYFKYMDFVITNINRITQVFTEKNKFSFEYDIILPVGISFYVLQSVGYLIDVYRGTEAEQEFFRFGLFISFFPQLVAGPIERTGNLMPQLKEEKKVRWENCKDGVYLILWGYFTKMVIADRAAIFIDEVYGNPSEYRGVFIIVATLLFAIQIYCDFYGYSTIARGIALCFGIRLMDNFNAPYLATSVTDFWKRWHISLTGWFRDYVYIPLGGNRKGEMKKQINRFFVFALSGLWHGASFAYIVWGILNAAFQTIGDLKKKGYDFLYKNHICGKRQDNFSNRLLQRLVTFGLICITWIFFRAGDLSDAIEIIGYAMDINWIVLFNGQLYKLGISEDFFKVLLISIIVLFVVDYCKYINKNVLKMIEKQAWWFQIGVILTLSFTILLFGIYGNEYDAAQFIYFQF